MLSTAQLQTLQPSISKIWAEGKVHMHCSAELQEMPQTVQKVYLQTQTRRHPRCQTDPPDTCMTCLTLARIQYATLEMGKCPPNAKRHVHRDDIETSCYMATNTSGDEHKRFSSQSLWLCAIMWNRNTLLCVSIICVQITYEIQHNLLDISQEVNNISI